MDTVTPQAVKAALDAARAMRPYAGFVKMSAETWSAVKEISLSPEPTAESALLAVPVVLDPDIPDGELRPCRFEDQTS